MITDYVPTLAATDYVTEPVVRMQSITKDFAMGDSTFRALDDVSIEIQRGEMVAIMGPSGSGKSTLMTLIGHGKGFGLIVRDVDRGEVRGFQDAADFDHQLFAQLTIERAEWLIQHQ